MTEFWYFLEEFDKRAESEKKQSRWGKRGDKYHPEDGNPIHWLKDPKYRAGSK